MRKILALVAVSIFLIAMGCSGGAPTLPKDTQGDPDTFFNTFDLSDPAVGEFTYTDNEGNVLSSGTIGKNDDGYYIIESRGAQFDVDVTALGLVACIVFYNNPAGTVPTGPNMGLPYYLIGQTMDYTIKVVSFWEHQIGGWNPPFGWVGPAELRAEMHYAYWNSYGKATPGDPMPGEYWFDWEGIISPGYLELDDTYEIIAGTIPGLDVTTVRIQAPVFFGCIDIIFFDGVAGIWDPIE